MGMRKSTRQELRMLRGIVRSVLEDVKCPFCREPLLADDNHYTHGAGEGSPLDVELTEHHKNGKHHDNRKKNRVWTHRSCHKSYHLALRHKQNREQKRRERKRLRKIERRERKLKLVA